MHVLAYMHAFFFGESVLYTFPPEHLPQKAGEWKEMYYDYGLDLVVEAYEDGVPMEMLLP